jgi:hypothetical protein
VSAVLSLRCAPPSAAKFYIETAFGSLILLHRINEPNAV